MTEKVNINGRDAWITVDPFSVNREDPYNTPNEYFVAYYSWEAEEKGETFKEIDESPKLFTSPVSALEYAQEELLKMG